MLHRRVASLQDGGKRIKISKDPTASTHFLPDRQRELEEQRLREQLAEEYVSAPVVFVTGEYTAYLLAVAACCMS